MNTLLSTRVDICVFLFQLSKPQKAAQTPDRTQPNTAVLNPSATLKMCQEPERDVYLRSTAVIFYSLGLCTLLPDIINPDKRDSEITHIKNCSLNSYNLYCSQWAWQQAIRRELYNCRVKCLQALGWMQAGFNFLCKTSALDCLVLDFECFGLSMHFL